jgi:hypothetical protein
LLPENGNCSDTVTLEIINDSWALSSQDSIKGKIIIVVICIYLNVFDSVKSWCARNLISTFVFIYNKWEMGVVGSIGLSATFNNISVTSWRSVVLMEETWVPGENHRTVASHWQTLYCIEYTSPSAGFELVPLVVIDCTSSCTSNYHRITTALINIVGLVYGV